MSNLQVPDPGLLAKLEQYLNDQTNWHSGAMLDLKVVCSDGMFYWSSLLLASLSPLLSSLLRSQDEELVLILPDATLETAKVLLKKVLKPNCYFLNMSEQQLLLLLGVDRSFCSRKLEQQNFVQIVGVGTGAGNTNNIRSYLEAFENDVDIIWKDHKDADNNQMEENTRNSSPKFHNLENIDDTSNEVDEIKMNDFDTSINIKDKDKPKKSGSGRKMFCKLCSLSFQSRPYADYQDHINSHKNAQGMYACNQPHCNRVFRAWCHLNDHVYSHGNLPKPHLCSYCSYTSTTRANIKKHEIAVHEDPDRRDFSCDKCAKKFKTTSNLYEHMRVHDPEYRHPCPICKKEFKSMVGYNQHLRLHSGDLFSCGACGEKFQSKHSVNRHEKDIHGIYNLPEGVKTFKCGKKTCAAEFSSEEDYRLHIKSAHQNKAGLLICHLCKKICSNRMTLKCHFRKMHQNEVDSLGKQSKKKSLLKLENFEQIKNKSKSDGNTSSQTCDCCDKRFRFKYQLLSHIAQKQGTGCYCMVSECPNSDHLFPSVESLELHLQEHTGEISYPCTLCFRRFTTSPARDKHLATHEEGQEGYNCPHCDVTQPSRMVLNMHVKYCNKKEDVDEEMVQLEQEDLITLESGIDSVIEVDSSKYICQDCGIVMNCLEQVPLHKCLKNYICGLCDIKLVSVDDLEKHNTMFHSKEEIRCLLCEEIVVEHNLEIHMKEKHLEKQLLHCEVCKKSFTSSQILQRHISTQHSKIVEEICTLCNGAFGEGASHEDNCPVRTMTACHYCDKTFSHRTSLNKHIKAVHQVVHSENAEELVLVVNTDNSDQQEEGGGVTVYQVGEETVEMEEQEMVITLQKEDMIVYQMEGV
eukprot:GFUD01019509.1.p1 GENE.GFUD01019509.1~~GFUD01019509.1.p1  ORF type:complete len:860 (+),score=163.23 GFUD01019509.1:61-2640(+)